MPHKSPDLDKPAFDCPHCGAYAHQTWYDAAKVSNSQFTLLASFKVAICAHCNQPAIWYQPKARDPRLRTMPRMVFPGIPTAPTPHPDLPEAIAADFQEARQVLGQSPRGAAALLRLCIQRICAELGQASENLNAAIGNLVAEHGLPKKVQQALDTVRVVGNEAVHPGKLDLRDDHEVALKLFDLVNLVWDVLVSQPRRVDALYQGTLTPEQKDQVRKRDSQG